MLPFSKSGSLNWRVAKDKTEGLADALTAADPVLLANAVEKKARQRFSLFLEGVNLYRHHTYTRNVEDPPVVAASGATRVLKYSGTAESSRASVFVVPSLVNQSYILDLSENNSFMRWLAAQGIDGYLVDWGRPGDTERGFDLSDYVAGRLEGLFDTVHSLSQRPLFVLGYCMGGNLALALAIRRQSHIAGLALLATPWDFHAADEASARALGVTAQSFEPQMTLLGELPTDILQLLFCMLDPLLGFRKFQHLAAMEPTSRRAENFVALEDWLNDGVPLVAAVARECLGRWYGENDTARGQWRISGHVVDPAAFSQPAIAMIPAQDRIVPPASALALASALPNNRILMPRAGHIGMMAGHNAESSVWRPLRSWLQEVLEKSF